MCQPVWSTWEHMSNFIYKPIKYLLGTYLHLNIFFIVIEKKCFTKLIWDVNRVRNGTGQTHLNFWSLLSTPLLLLLNGFLLSFCLARPHNVVNSLHQQVSLLALSLHLVHVVCGIKKSEKEWWVLSKHCFIMPQKLCVEPVVEHVSNCQSPLISINKASLHYNYFDMWAQRQTNEPVSRTGFIHL